MPKTRPNSQTTTTTEMKAREIENTQPDFSTARSRMIMVMKPDNRKSQIGNAHRHKCETGGDAEHPPQRRAARKVRCNSFARRPQQQHNARAHNDQGRDKGE